MLGTLLLAMTLAVGAPAAAPEVLVVCPRELRRALEPWLEYRRQQGYTIECINGDGTNEDIRRAIRGVASRSALKYIVLVGDADFGMVRRVPWTIPAWYLQAQAVVKHGSEPELATDNAYADTDDDGAPDLAIGRLPVDTSKDLTRLIERIIQYETSNDCGPWRRRVNLVAGLGGFGALVDGAIETAAKSLLTHGIPSVYTTTMTYASWRSPYCPDPHGIREATLSRLNEGCLFWVYIGHAQPWGLDAVRMPDGTRPIFEAADVARLHAAHGSPIAVMLACYTGAYDAPRDSLAEQMLRADGGPVAVLAGSRVTMPYGMSVLGTELLDQCFTADLPTLGDVVLSAKRNMLLAPRNDARSQLLDSLAGLLAGGPDQLAIERMEHVALFNLLGDPLLALRRPQPVELRVVNDAVAGGQIVVEGRTPVIGQAEVELVVRRDRLRFAPPKRDAYDASPESRILFDAVYRQANDPRLATGSALLEVNDFTMTFDVPATAAGDCHVRVYIEGDGEFAAGAADVTIRRASEPVFRAAREVRTLVR